MKISKKTREQAIFVLDVASSNVDMTVVEIADQLDASDEACDLAAQAYGRAWWDLGLTEARAEAAARLREGWVPPQDDSRRWP